MADSVKVIAQLAFIPASTSLAAATVRQTFGAQATLANIGSLQTMTLQMVGTTINGGIIPPVPQYVTIPPGMVMFVVDDAVNPADITFSGTFTAVGPTTITQSQTAYASGQPYIGVWACTSATTITSTGFNTTTVRLFFWGN
jgi:hypothetical protein